MAESEAQPEASVAQGFQQIVTPRFWGTNFSVVGTSGEVVLLVGSTVAAVGPDGTVAGGTAPAVQINMPPLAAKELTALLSDFVKSIETQLGAELTSPFLKERAGK